jgi:NADH-dependent peroxiredoxin subunit F
VNGRLPVIGVEGDAMDFNLSLGSLASEHKAIPLDHARIYDVLILGGGPAALTAAVYCMRKGVSTGLVTMDFGGQVAETTAVENYMGYKYIEGIQLTERFKEQVNQFEISIAQGRRVSGIKPGGNWTVVLDDGNTCSGRAIIITTGKSWRKLNVPGEKELTGRGVAYCATCDAPLFAGKRVVVVGGGNSGVESAIDLAKIAESVTLVQFLPTLTADKVLVDALAAFKNVHVLYEHEIAEIRGATSVNSVSVRARAGGAVRDLDVQGIFIEIGLVPNTDFVKGLLDLNEAGEILVDSSCQTSAKGIFAAGDVTSVPYKQIIIAAGEGAKAALAACEYLLKNR